MARQPQLNMYQEGDAWNACFRDHHEELKKILQHHGVDVDWAHPEFGTTAVLVAAWNGYDKCLAHLIARGANMTLVAKNGAAAIHAVCQIGNYACLELLANSGADLNLHTTEELGSTPAMICCEIGHAKMLALLSDRGADLDSTNNYSQTASHIACQYGQRKCLKLLGKRGADLNKKDRTGGTPLDYARALKQRECIDYLITNGATGMRNDDIGPLSDARKVGMACALSETESV
jgi:ankyrin repeat protein